MTGGSRTAPSGVNDINGGAATPWATPFGMIYLEPRDTPPDCIDKGVPYGPTRGAWNVLADDLHFPLLVLKETALAHNIAVMAEWCRRNGFLLAPHGKTTMCPRIYRRQMEAGAWAITVANVSQAMVCVRSGVRRILIANQVMGRAAAASLVGAMKDIPDLEVYCLVDSVETVSQLAAHLDVAGTPRPMQVLIEWGMPGWRTGARSLAAALRVHDEMKRHGRLMSFAGVEGFEGLAQSERGADEVIRQVDEFLKGVLQLGSELASGGATRSEAPLFSVGGTAFLDRIAAVGRAAAGRFRVVLRSGCYVTHDHALYRDKLQAARQRAGDAAVPEFMPALELWAFVQSLPDPGLAIVSFGKRDCAYDIGLPIPLFAVPRSRPFKERLSLMGAQITRLNDQHAYLSGAPEVLSVGDRLCCGISHPCTAFDKWRAIPVVDDLYNVRDWYRTYF
jgi:D-serine dehydratase